MLPTWVQNRLIISSISSFGIKTWCDSWQTYAQGTSTKGRSRNIIDKERSWRRLWTMFIFGSTSYCPLNILFTSSTCPTATVYLLMTGDSWLLYLTFAYNPLRLLSRSRPRPTKRPKRQKNADRNGNNGAAASFPSSPFVRSSIPGDIIHRARSSEACFCRRAWRKLVTIFRDDFRPLHHLRNSPGWGSS